MAGQSLVNSFTPAQGMGLGVAGMTGGPGWQRHVVLTALAYSFLQIERRRRGQTRSIVAQRDDRIDVHGSPRGKLARNERDDE